jgi:uroporphyrinogen-III synthase
MNKGSLVVVTGEAASSRQLAAILKHQGLRAKALPTIQFKPLPLSATGVAALRQLDSFDYLLFSSPRAISYFAKVLRIHHIPKFKKIPRIVIIGPASELANKMPSVRGKKILFPRSAVASHEAPRLLRRRGALVTPLPIYTTLPAAPLKKPPFSPGNPPALILFLSSSSVTGFSKQVGRGTLKRTALEALAVCLGPQTARAAKAFGFKHRKTILLS